MHYQADHLTQLREQHRSVDDLLLGALIGELRRVSMQLVEVMYVPVEKRVHRRLVDLAGLFGHSAPITIPLTQAELAQLTGTTRSTVNRVLRSAEEAGDLSVGRGRIDVLDLAGLERRGR
jgi:CRP/FNR family transcriptional regulator, cyclic AMP receptor protein